MSAASLLRLLPGVLLCMALTIISVVLEAIEVRLFHQPYLEALVLAIILGVVRILDMCRTTLNVVGDITAATYVARSEGYELLKTHEPAIVHAGVRTAD